MYAHEGGSDEWVGGLVCLSYNVIKLVVWLVSNPVFVGHYMCSKGYIFLDSLCLVKMLAIIYYLLFLCVSQSNTQSTDSFCLVCECSSYEHGWVLCNRYLPDIFTIINAEPSGNYTLILRTDFDVYYTYKAEIDRLFYNVLVEDDSIISTTTPQTRPSKEQYPSQIKPTQTIDKFVTNLFRSSAKPKTLTTTSKWQPNSPTIHTRSNNLARSSARPKTLTTTSKWLSKLPTIPAGDVIVKTQKPRVLTTKPTQPSVEMFAEKKTTPMKKSWIQKMTPRMITNNPPSSTDYKSLLTERVDTKIKNFTSKQRDLVRNNENTTGLDSVYSNRTIGSVNGTNVITVASFNTHHIIYTVLGIVLVITLIILVFVCIRLMKYKNVNGNIFMRLRSFNNPVYRDPNRGSLSNLAEDLL